MLLIQHYSVIILALYNFRPLKETKRRKEKNIFIAIFFFNVPSYLPFLTLFIFSCGVELISDGNFTIVYSPLPSFVLLLSKMIYLYMLLD